MKTTALILLFASLSFTIKAVEKDSTDIVFVGDQIPSFSIKKNGEVFSSSDLLGKTILITLFATWCPPCQTELAEIENKLWPKFRDEENFVLLVIGREHSDQELLKYNEKKGFSFPLYPDKDRTIYNSFAKQLIPRTYLVNKNGEIVYITKGFDSNEFSELCKYIEQDIIK